MAPLLKILMLLIHIPMYIGLLVVFFYFTFTNLLRTYIECKLDKRAEKYWTLYYKRQEQVYKQLFLNLL